MQEKYSVAILGRMIKPNTDPGGTGFFSVATVPEDEFWEVYWVHAGRSVGSTLTLSNLFVFDNEVGEYASIKRPSAAGEQQWEVPEGLMLKPGDELVITVAAYAAGDKVSTDAYYRRWKRSS